MSALALPAMPAATRVTPMLWRCLLLALLLHVWLLLLLGSAPGGTARQGEGVWGAIDVTLRGPPTPGATASVVPPPLRQPGPPVRPGAAALGRRGARGRTRSAGRTRAAQLGEWARQPTPDPAPPLERTRRRWHADRRTPAVAGAASWQEARRRCACRTGADAAPARRASRRCRRCPPRRGRRRWRSRAARARAPKQAAPAVLQPACCRARAPAAGRPGRPPLPRPAWSPPLHWPRRSGVDARSGGCRRQPGSTLCHAAAPRAAGPSPPPAQRPRLRRAGAAAAPARACLAPAPRRRSVTTAPAAFGPGSAPPPPRPRGGARGAHRSQRPRRSPLAPACSATVGCWGRRLPQCSRAAAGRRYRRPRPSRRQPARRRHCRGWPAPAPLARRPRRRAGPHRRRGSARRRCARRRAAGRP